MIEVTHAGKSYLIPGLWADNEKHATMSLCNAIFHQNPQTIVDFLVAHFCRALSEYRNRWNKWKQCTAVLIPNLFCTRESVAIKTNYHVAHGMCYYKLPMWDPLQKVRIRNSSNYWISTASVVQHSFKLTAYGDFLTEDSKVSFLNICPFCYHKR